MVDQESYGIDTLFMDQDQTCEQEAARIILERTRNKLFQIFTKCCGNKIPKQRYQGMNVGVLTTPEKRKISSSQPEPFNEGPARTAQKIRRLGTDVNQLGEKTRRPRLQTISGQINPKVKQEKKRRQRNTSLPKFDPRQTFLSNLWARKCGASMLSNNPTEDSSGK